MLFVGLLDRYAVVEDLGPSENLEMHLSSHVEGSL